MNENRKLLLADDSLTIQKVVELVLVHENFEIKALNDGEQALDALESFGPDIVLADIEMPKLNGYQLCEKIKNNASTLHIPVILLAGAFEPFDEEYARSVGADDYIIKPFESQELISKVKALLVKLDEARAAMPQETPMQESEAAEDPAEMTVETPDLPPQVEEPKWDEDIPVASEKTEEQQMADEEYEAKIALSSTGFDDELSEAMRTEKAPVSINESVGALELPSKDEICEMVKQAVDEKVSDAVNEARESINRIISERISEVLEVSVRESVKETLSSLRREVNSSIARIVPEIAEAIIKKEIEKITSEL